MTLQEIIQRIDMITQAIDSDSVPPEEKSKLRFELLKLIELKHEKRREISRRGGYGL
jgi:hypothetical protein